MGVDYFNMPGLEVAFLNKISAWKFFSTLTEQQPQIPNAQLWGPYKKKC